MAKRRRSKRIANNKWDISDLLEAYGLEAVKEAAIYINEQAQNLRDEAIKNIDTMKIGADTEYYETLGKRKLWNGTWKTYRVKRYYKSTGNLKNSTKVGLIDVNSIDMKNKTVKATMANVAKDKNGKYYGMMVEYGKHPKPFFYKAFYERRSKIRDTLCVVLQNAWARGNKK